MNSRVASTSLQLGHEYGPDAVRLGLWEHRHASNVSGRSVCIERSTDIGPDSFERFEGLKSTNPDDTVCPCVRIVVIRPS